jgi:hypothetical protein
MMKLMKTGRDGGNEEKPQQRKNEREGGGWEDTGKERALSSVEYGKSKTRKELLWYCDASREDSYRRTRGEGYGK